MNRIGERIKKHREQLNMPLAELSKKVGISISALSQIEHAKAFPSIITLKAIAENLSTTVGELIGENESLTRNPSIKKGEEKFVKANATGSSLYLLSHHCPGKQMEPFLIKIPPGSDSSDLISRHPGQAFLKLLEGKALVTLDKKDYTLVKGDNFYYNTNLEFVMKNPGRTTCSALWIISPPFM